MTGNYWTHSTGRVLYQQPKRLTLRLGPPVMAGEGWAPAMTI